MWAFRSNDEPSANVRVSATACVLVVIHTMSTDIKFTRTSSQYTSIIRELFCRPIRHSYVVRSLSLNIGHRAKT